MVAASYTRKSIRYGEPISIADQNAYIAEFARKHQVTISKKYSDRKDSTDAEDGFLEMKEDAIFRKFDCVFMWSFMCFGKDPLIGYNLMKHTFLPAGIHFAIAKDDFISVGKTSEEIEAYLEKKYKERRDYTARNNAVKARASRVNMCYGYKDVNGSYVIDEEVKPIIDTIFSMALEGKHPKEICNWLNSQQIDPPLIYLKKRAGKVITDDSKKWIIEIVGKILSDVKYKGLRRVTCDGTEEFLPIPAYIDDSQYEKLNGHKIVRECKKERANPLFRKVFDKYSGHVMRSGDYLNNGKKYYYIYDRTEETRQYKKKAILADDVLSVVITALNREREAALNVQKLLTTSDVGQMEFQKQTQKYRKELKTVFEQMLCYADSGDITEFQKLDQRFSELQETVNYYEKMYSPLNPWISLYREVGDDPLSLKKAKRFVDKVLIEKNERVEVLLFYSEYRDLLPKAWLEGV